MLWKNEFEYQKKMKQENSIIQLNFLFVPNFVSPSKREETHIIGYLVMIQREYYMTFWFAFPLRFLFSKHLNLRKMAKHTMRIYIYRNRILRLWKWFIWHWKTYNKSLEYPLHLYSIHHRKSGPIKYSIEYKRIYKTYISISVKDIIRDCR